MLCRPPNYALCKQYHERKVFLIPALLVADGIGRMVAGPPFTALSRLPLHS